MEAEKSIDSDHHDEGEDHAGQDAPSRDDSSIVVLIIFREDEDPNALSDDGQAVESNTAEQSNETMVVLAPNAVVQVLAVMVELFRASVAMMTVVAGSVYIYAAFRADL